MPTSSPATFSGACPLADAAWHVLPDGGRMRYAVFEPAQNPRATLLVALGRREFIEKKFFELGREFLERNFRLVIFDWRGQGLSSRRLDGPRRQRDYVLDFAAHLDDLSSFYQNVVRARQAGALFVYGHSMGAHLLLRWLAERQKTGVQAAILTAPMLAIGPRAMHRIGEVMCRTALRFGKGEDYAPAQKDYGDHERQFAGNPLTHDPERFAFMERYFDAHPDLVAGGVTWAWLGAALRSMRLMRAEGYYDAVTLPVLTMTGAQDPVTPPRELRHYILRMPHATHIEIPGALHDLPNETENLRSGMWRHIDGFLAKV